MSTSPLPLWPHQARSIEQVMAAIARGVRRILLTLPTGAGKTRVATELIQRWLAEELRTVLYTNRKLLVEQTVNVMERAGIKHGVRASGWDSALGRDVQVSSIQTEHARAIKSQEWPLHDAHRVIVDEAHLQSASQARRILDMHAEDGAVILGLTATPLDLGDVYDELLQPARMQELRECGALVVAHHYGPDEPDTRLIKRSKSGEIIVESVVKAIMTQTIVGRVVEGYRRFNPEGKAAILFGPDVASSVGLAEELTKAGIPAAHIDGQQCWWKGELLTSRKSLRRDIIAASKSGEIKVLCNRFVLREGLDLPWLEHAILATVFGSLQSYLQSLGRVLRASPKTGKARATIQDHGGNWWRWGSINAERHWELVYTGRMVEALRESSFREGGEREPVRCPRCQAIRKAFGPTCPICGFVAQDGARKSRPVIQLDGSIQEHTGDIYKPRRVKLTANTKRKWEQCFYRCRKKGKTFNQARGLFVRENYYWPPKTLPLMPREPLDWFARIDTVPPERLIPATPQRQRA